MAEGQRGKARKHLNQRLDALHQRAMQIEEQLKALDSCRFYRACIFGSARIKPDSEEYKEAYELARYFAWAGIDVLTGGGHGLMEAANKGAQLGREEQKTKSLSYGISIQLPHEPEPNMHLDIKRHHYKFSSRLDDFIRLSNAIVCLPGGIGTLLELAFSWQLIQVKHIKPRPIVLLDKKFWEGFLTWMRGDVLARGLISEHDFDSIITVDTPQEAFEVVSKDFESWRKVCEIG